MIVINLEITGNNSLTILPRCLMTLSRRGFSLQKLETDYLPGGIVRLRCVVRGPAAWRTTLPGLIAKIHEVDSAKAVRIITYE